MKPEKLKQLILGTAGDKASPCAATSPGAKLPSPDSPFDLEERLLSYATRIIRFSARIPRTRAGNHVAGQLLKSGTSPLPNHGEAQAAESQADFIHKLKICLKELRESYRWLKLVQRVPLVRNDSDQQEAAGLIDETDQLIRIFCKSVATAQQNQAAKRRP